jgi:hypothetical protein
LGIYVTLQINNKITSLLYYTFTIDYITLISTISYAYFKNKNYDKPPPSRFAAAGGEQYIPKHPLNLQRSHRGRFMRLWRHLPPPSQKRSQITNSPPAVEGGGCPTVDGDGGESAHFPFFLLSMWFSPNMIPWSSIGR